MTNPISGLAALCAIDTRPTTRLAPDPATGQTVPLFNPRLQDWFDVTTTQPQPILACSQEGRKYCVRQLGPLIWVRNIAGARYRLGMESHADPHRRPHFDHDNLRSTH